MILSGLSRPVFPLRKLRWPRALPDRFAFAVPRCFVDPCVPRLIRLVEAYTPLCKVPARTVDTMRSEMLDPTRP